MNPVPATATVTAVPPAVADEGVRLETAGNGFSLGPTGGVDPLPQPITMNAINAAPLAGKRRFINLSNSYAPNPIPRFHLHLRPRFRRLLEDPLTAPLH
jgi:hypothetical protein